MKKYIVFTINIAKHNDKLAQKSYTNDFCVYLELQSIY